MQTCDRTHARAHTHTYTVHSIHTQACVPLDTSPRVGPGCRADLTEIFKSQFCPQNMLPACRSQESRLWESCTDPVNEALIKKIAVPKFQQGVAVRQKLVVQLGRRCCRLAQERLHLFREPLHQFLEQICLGQGLQDLGRILCKVLAPLEAVVLIHFDDVF